MTTIIHEFESTSAELDYYDFQGCILTNIKTEPFFLRHEYYDHEMDVKQSLSLFTRRTEERGSQVFIDWYRDFERNINYRQDLSFYEKQRKKFKVSNANEGGPLNLVPKVKGEVSCAQLTTKDGKYRRRIVYNIQGKTEAVLLVFSIDSENFAESSFFKFVKDNVQLDLK